MLLLGSHCFAELPPVEGENGPPSPPIQRWKFRPQEADSDDQLSTMEIQVLLWLGQTAWQPQERGCYKRAGSGPNTT
jgi:hypothetical protein